MRFIDTVKELLLVYISLVLLCAGIYAYLENTTYISAVWWACVTALTIGYGDMYPATTGGKVLAILLMHTTVLFILPLMIGNICSLCIKNRNEFTEEEQEDIRTMLQRLDDRLNTLAEKEKIGA